MTYDQNFQLGHLHAALIFSIQPDLGTTDLDCFDSVPGSYRLFQTAIHSVTVTFGFSIILLS